MTDLLAEFSKVSSLAEASIRQMQLYLADASHAFWIPLVGVDGWHEALFATIGAVAYEFLGGLALRCVFNFLEWPWPIPKILLPETTADERLTIESQVRDLRDCCPSPSDGFTIRYRDRLRRPDLSSDGNKEFVDDVFTMCSSTNIETEDRHPSEPRVPHIR